LVEIAARVTEVLADLILMAPPNEQTMMMADVVANLGGMVLEKCQEGESSSPRRSKQLKRAPIIIGEICAWVMCARASLEFSPQPYPLQRPPTLVVFVLPHRLATLPQLLGWRRRARQPLDTSSPQPHWPSRESMANGGSTIAAGMKGLPTTRRTTITPWEWLGQ
jgi:hypothetical protein